MVLGHRGVVTALSVLIVAGTLGLGPSAQAASPPTRTPSYPIASTAVPAGAQRLHFEVGPIMVRAGQNSISFTSRIPQPAENGWIVGMRTNLHRADGTVPPVNVIHLHHGVWIDLSNQDATSGGPQRFFAAGEEKTTLELPKGYGYQYQSTDKWVLNYMLHNATPTPEPIWITYDIALCSM